MHVENVYIKCSIELLIRIGKERSLSAKIYTRNERLTFRNYVWAFCNEMTPSGKINQLQPKIVIPQINQVYKKSKVNRLSRIIHELIAENYEKVLAGRGMEECPHMYHHQSRI